jgi:Ca-activated chloride channel family protein
MLHARKLLFTFLLLFGAFYATANAQGVIVPIICEKPVPRCVPPPRPVILPLQLPVKSIKIDTKINAQVAVTRVEQIFRNDTDATLEGTYFFPIPETASISEFAIWENDKKLVGEVRSREEARRIYETIVRRQRDPGLLEYAGHDLFQATIFPIQPRSDKKLEITYTQILRAENNTVNYRYPLGTGAKAWIPANFSGSGGGDDAAIRRGNEPKIGTVSGKIEIETGEKRVRNIYSPSHEIEINQTKDNRAVVSFESTANREQQDFQLFYAVSGDDFGLSLVTYKETGRDGYFLLALSPKDSLSEREFAAKDIVFVIDTSGSMADEGKMEKARAALLFGIKNLRETDRVNVISFAGEEHLMENAPVKADNYGKTRGEQFVKALKPTGGTNINDALRAAVRQFDNSERPKMLVFLTDGLPTVGETRIEKIVENLRENRNRVENLRIFTFGVGYDVNTQLLDKIASENGGVSDYVEPKENLEVKVSNFFAKVSSPVLTDLQIDWGGVQTDLIYPRRLPDIFKGTQLTLIGRYKSDGGENAMLTLRGRSEKETRSFSYPNLRFPARAEENDFLPRLWASRRVGWLLEQIRSNGENKELRDEIIDLGTRYGIVTPYTSYLAADGSVRTIVDSQNIFVRERGKQLADVQTGTAAVQLSKQQNLMQANESVAAKENETIFLSNKFAQQVGTKTFYNQDNNIWQDAEFKPEANLPEIKLRFASEEYFALLKREKDLARYFALGEKVIVVYKGKIYRVVK